MMPVPAVCLEARGIARLEHGLAAVFDQHDFAFEHVDQLVFSFMPVPQRRRRAGLKRGEIDAELVEADCVAQTLAFAAEHHAVERRRIIGAGVDWKLGDIDLRHHTRSMIVAVPMPAPMQSVTSPIERLRRSSSSTSVPRIIAPVAPSGWPSAMAPPLTLTLDESSWKACRKRSTTEAKASLISKRSMSDSFIPAVLSTFLVTSTGPVSISAGSEPILAKARTRARGLRPAFCPASLLPTRTAAAPSTIPEELPA